MDFKHLLVPEKKAIKLKDFPTDQTDPFKDKAEATGLLEADIRKLADLQAKLAAQDIYAVLVILQGMDAAGKDSTIKHVMSGVNPSGCQVTSFKAPSSEELDHDYLWRHVKALPQRGVIGIFNRSYYEEVLVVRIHPELLSHEKIEPAKKNEKIWSTRFDEMNNFERYLAENGTVVLKFFLHLSKDEQKRRFLERLETPDKNWKYSEDDVAERMYWDDYLRAYEDMLSHTSTSYAPWHVIPADRKWFMRVAVANILVQRLESLDLRFPAAEGEQKKAIDKARKLLEKEK